MISVKLYAYKGIIIGFEVSGHTGVRGESIVCAAVSSACYMAANTITDVLHIDADISLDDGLMSVVLNEADAVKSEVVLKGLELHLEALSEQYPKQIKLQFSEVQQLC